MITRIEAQGYKCLRQVGVDVGSLNVLVGPNASGKSTLLDVVGFVQDALRLDGDVGRAVRLRARSLGELHWRESPEGSLLAIGVARAGDRTGARAQSSLRYFAFLAARDQGKLTWGGEALLELGHDRSQRAIGEILAMDEQGKPLPLPSGERVLIIRHDDGTNLFMPREGVPWRYRSPRERLALSLVPEDPEQFPETIWLRSFLRDRVHRAVVDPSSMRVPCPPDAPSEYQPDGSNMPLLVQQIEGTDRFDWWIEHLALVMHGLKTLEVVEEPHNRHLYIVAVYKDGLRVPAWRLSDGTLRFIALTLIAYLPPEDRVFIIEEPENGMHPQAIEYLMQSLTSVYEGQVFLATHSPIIVGLTDPENLLCFSLDEQGATQIVRGSEHPELAKWREALALSDMFAAGILG